MTNINQRHPLYAAALAIALIGGCALPPGKQARMAEPSALSADSQSNTIDLSLVTVRLPYDKAKTRIQYGWFCEYGKEVTWPNDSLPVSRRDIEETFRQALGPLNYKFPKPSTSVFESRLGEGADLLLGAVVTEREANLCFPLSGSSNLSFGNINSAKGSTYLQITWEVFSVIERRVVFKTTTEGAFQTGTSIVDGEKVMTLNAFKASLLGLAADPKFKELILRRQIPPPSSDTARPSQT